MKFILQLRDRVAESLEGRHRALGLVVAAGAAERLATWLADPNPLLYGDSGVYLRAALDPVLYEIQPKGVSLFWRLVGVDLSHILVANFVLTLVIAYMVWKLSNRFWMGAVVVLNPLTLAHERLMLAEHFFAALVTLGVFLLIRKNPLAGAVLGLAAVTRTIGLVLVLPLVLFLARRWWKPILAVGMLAVVLVWYSANYVYPSTGARTISFLGPNAISVVARIADCPPAPEDVCRWKNEHPNAIIFNQQGPLQSRLKSLGWKKTDEALRPIVFRAMLNHPVKFAVQYLGRVPHLFSLSFFYEQGGSPPLYGPAVQALERIDGAKPHPTRSSARTRGWDRLIKLFTVMSALVVVAGLLSGRSPEILMSCLLLLLGSVLFNDATARFLYPVTPLLLTQLRVPPWLRRRRGSLA